MPTPLDTGPRGSAVAGQLRPRSTMLAPVTLPNCTGPTGSYVTFVMVAEKMFGNANQTGPGVDAQDHVGTLVLCLGNEDLNKEPHDQSISRSIVFFHIPAMYSSSGRDCIVRVTIAAKAGNLSLTYVILSCE